jgi:3D (Asp-Asp-Asp) domain-containing protein/peptidoglycan hydrolase CwlO-like protein
VRAPGPGFRALLFACLAALASSLPAAGAQPASRLQAEAEELRQANQSLAGQVASAQAELGNLEAELASTRARLAKLRAQGERLARRQAEARTQLEVARAGLRISQRRLADRVRALYEQGEPEPLAVILGAKTLDEAVSSVEHLSRVAADDRQNIQRARSARKKLISLTAVLAQREAENESLRAAASQAAGVLLRARAQRLSRIASLAALRDSNGQRISALESTARSLTAVASAPGPAGSTVLQPPSAGGSRLLTVVATGYSLPGSTASGIPVGPGVVAVDPAVIPLGTPLSIPGYGQGIAADTGGAIQGARIDLWFSSHADALAWGRRTVTIAVGG